MIANATSVTRNLLSTSQFCPTLPTIAAAHPSRPIPGRIWRSSARKVNAHRSPHHAAGAVLRARDTSRGTHHFRSTPKMTATRGCRADGIVWLASLLVDVWDVEAGEGGTAVDVSGEATALSRKTVDGVAREGPKDVGVIRFEAER